MHIYESDTDVVRYTLLNMYVFKSLINAVAYYYLALDILYIHFFKSVMEEAEICYLQVWGFKTRFHCATSLILEAVRTNTCAL